MDGFPAGSPDFMSTAPYPAKLFKPCQIPRQFQDGPLPEITIGSAFTLMDVVTGASLTRTDLRCVLERSKVALMIWTQVPPRHPCSDKSRISAMPELSELHLLPWCFTPSNRPQWIKLKSSTRAEDESRKSEE